MFYLVRMYVYKSATFTFHPYVTYIKTIVKVQIKVKYRVANTCLHMLMPCLHMLMPCLHMLMPNLDVICFYNYTTFPCKQVHTFFVL